MIRVICTVPAANLMRRGQSQRCATAVFAAQIKQILWRLAGLLYRRSANEVACQTAHTTAVGLLQNRPRQVKHRIFEHESCGVDESHPRFQSVASTFMALAKDRGSHHSHVRQLRRKSKQSQLPRVEGSCTMQGFVHILVLFRVQLQVRCNWVQALRNLADDLAQAPPRFKTWPPDSVESAG